MKELFVGLVDGVEKGLGLQDGDGHHLLDLGHVFLENVLVELVNLVVGFLLGRFGDGVEGVAAVLVEGKGVWVEIDLVA